MADQPVLPPQQDIVVYSTVWCPDCKRAKRFFSEHRVPYKNVDVEENPEGMALIEKVNQGKHRIPTIVFPDGSVLVEPSNAQLAEKLGLQSKARHDFYEAIVVGGGPAGLTAAVYLAREGVETLVIEKSGLGGQAGTTQSLENFPGFHEGITGAEFANRLERQARRFGVEILQAQTVVDITRIEPCTVIRTNDGLDYDAGAVLLATGARYRRMNVPGEDGLIGASIHFCATCDGPFYKGKKLLVVGGGNSGFEEGYFLTRFASQVDIVEFQPEIKASEIAQEQVARQPNMSVATNTRVVEFKGNHKLESVVLENRTTGQIYEQPYDGVFVYIGLDPNSDVVRGKVELDPQGFVVTDQTLRTSMPGLFAAGDVRAGSTKQAASAVGEGATAALMMREYLKQAS